MQNKTLSTTLSTTIILAGLIGSSAACAGTMPTIYGQLNLGLLNADNDEAERVWQTENQASRLGIKGEQALENGLALIYQYETGIHPAENEKPIFSQRNSFVGISSPYGEIITGNFDTPLKAAQAKVDLFNDTHFDMSEFLAGEVRHKQSVQYTSPTLLNAISAQLDWLPAAEKAAKDGYSAALHYRSSLFEMSVAADHQVAGDSGVLIGKSAALENLRVQASFSPIERLKVGLIAQQSKGLDDDQSVENGWLASAAWSAEKLTLKAQIGQGTASKDAAGEDSDASIRQASLGVDYSLGKNTLAYAYSGIRQTKNGAGDTSTDGKNSNSTASTGFGLKYKF
ncbi:Outer membrane protein (porin) [gamma proteobacterium HdN1]|nr:Outer membrane protein (porin) [gamma proteobacterium HdN1]